MIQLLAQHFLVPIALALLLLVCVIRLFGEGD
jgi:hypothetical protein